MIDSIYKQDYFWGFDWWPVEYPWTPAEFDHLWRGLIIGLPPIGRGKRWINCATPEGQILDKNGLLENFTIPGCWVDGFRGAWALELDGVNDRVRFADSAANRVYDLQDAISFDAWIYPEETNDVVIAAKRDAGNYAWELCITADPNNNLQAKINADVNAATSAASIPENQWSHVGFTYDRKNITCFINGRQDGIAAFAAAINVINTDITLGSNLTAAPRWFDGRFATARLWNRKLDGGQWGEFYELYQYAYGMYKFDDRLFSAANFMARYSLPMFHNAQGSIGRIRYDGVDTRHRNQMTSFQRTTDVSRALPEDAGRKSESLDGGPRAMHEMTSRSHGAADPEYNAHARGLQIRKDKYKRLP
jgi:hypothetical protein